MSQTVDDYLREQARVPFAWGSADCVHFAAGMVELLTGKNPMEFYRYSSEPEARARIATAGSLRALVSAELGEPAIVRLGGTEIESGDIVLTTYGGIGEVVGIAAPPVAWFRQAGRRGLIPAPLDQCLCFWRPQCPRP